MESKGEESENGDEETMRDGDARDVIGEEGRMVIAFGFGFVDDNGVFIYNGGGDLCKEEREKGSTSKVEE